MPDFDLSAANGSRFAGMTALVTGAAGGIGFAIARRLAAEKCRVMMTDIDGARLTAAARPVSEGGADILVEVADIAVSEQRETLVPKLVERWGRIDVLVNNAANHGARLPFMDASEDEWERVFATNVTATAALCRAAARDMRNRQSGSIVNLVSVQMDLPVPTYAAYVSSKGAILSLTRALAVELSPHSIRVNAVSPGVIATENFKGALTGGHAAAAHSAALLRRQGLPDEVAAAAVFLASAEASFITGTTIYVDGGRRLSRRPDPFQAEFGDGSSNGND